MKITNLKHRAEDKFFQYINERKGWKTERKIIVIESDDWGSIRMPSREVYEKCIEKGIKVNKSPYNKYDSLASKEDFEHLYSVLSRYTDKNGKHPVITANTLVANPDFERIRKENFSQYYYERFTDTLKQYSNCSIDSWYEGIEKKVFFPQLHGREHLNVSRWMTHLQSPSKEMLFSFDNRLIGLSPSITNNKIPSFVQAFDQNSYLEQHSLETILRDASEIFKDIFSYNSQSFIAPNYIWNKAVEENLAKLDIKYIQGGGTQIVKNGQREYHYLGQTNAYKQLYLTRNVIYEPSNNPRLDWNSIAIKQINKAFKLNKPAVICMHRVNFIGSIFEENRVHNLNLFNTLLNTIMETWPEVEFMNSVDLGRLIES